ncbi:MAG: hypothetical protein MK226_21745 [Saprospiraceae bacterium]|jgi:hypothetical protein|nr:hypothetical protein [Saprospiraceae bacterium]
MLKILVLGGIVYFIYRFYIAPPTLNKADEQPPITNKAKSQEQKDDGEFIDYEEVD